MRAFDTAIDNRSFSLGPKRSVSNLKELCASCASPHRFVEFLLNVQPGQ